MSKKKNVILVLNPGSTSIKIALFEQDRCIAERNLNIKLMDIVDNFRDYEMTWESEPIKLVLDFLEEEGVPLNRLGITVARGGPLPPLKSGAYGINDLLINTLRYAHSVKHPAILGPAMARLIGDRQGIPSIIYDADSVDEADEMEHLTGLPEIRRTITSHNLNGKLMSLKLAEDIGKPYEEANFIVVHMGGGISIAAHNKGRVVDSLFINDGPMTPTRTGILPIRQFLDLCFSGKYSYDEMRKFIISRGGLMAYLGTSDAIEVEKMIAEGNQKAEIVYRAMAYQTSKGIGQMAVSLRGKVDAILLTGGMAHSKIQTDWIAQWVDFLAPIYIYPGSEEMKALAQGAQRVLEGKEIAKKYEALPVGYDSLEEFYSKFNL